MTLAPSAVLLAATAPLAAAVAAIAAPARRAVAVDPLHALRADGE